MNFKFDSYCSFKVGCPAKMCTRLMHGENWSSGILISKYIPVKFDKQSIKLESLG